MFSLDKCQAQACCLVTFCICSLFGIFGFRVGLFLLALLVLGILLFLPPSVLRLLAAVLAALLQRGVD